MVICPKRYLWVDDALLCLFLVCFQHMQAMHRILGYSALSAEPGFILTTQGRVKKQFRQCFHLALIHTGVICKAHVYIDTSAELQVF